MALNVVHDSIDDVPENYRELYVEREGKFHLNGIGGLKTQADVDRIQDGLAKEREDHKATKDRFLVWEGMEYEDVAAKLDRIPELELMAKNKDEFEAQLDELTEKRLTSRVAPVERELKAQTVKLESAIQELETLRTEKKQRLIHDAIDKSSIESKMRPEVKDDAFLLGSAVFEITETGEILTKENPYGVSPGLSPDLFMLEMQDKKPYWWELSSGGGSKGSGGGGSLGTNPWSRKGWDETAQGHFLKKNGMQKATEYAAREGLKLGQSHPPLPLNTQ